MARYIEFNSVTNKIMRAWDLWEKRGEDCIVFSDIIMPILIHESTKEVTPIVLGKWILDKEHSIENKIFICSNCNVAVEFQGIRRYNFCPKCGAKMEEEE